MLAADASAAINVITACDDGYAQHAHVFVASMLRSNPTNRFRVFILVPERFSYAGILNELEEYPHCELRLIHVPADLVSHLPVHGHVTSAAYFRLLMGQLLPSDLERVLYFDSDIVVRGDLLPLWKTDLRDHIIGAVTDGGLDLHAGLKKKIGISDHLQYFNSGMMLIDLKRWRSEHVAQHALDFCRDHPERLSYWDQCALNYALAGRVEELDVMWNFQTFHLSVAYHLRRIETTGPIMETLRKSKVIHFSSPVKPWQYRCRHPAARMYWEILRTTPWRDYVPPDRTIIRRLARPLLLTMSVLRRQLTQVLPNSVLRRLRTFILAWKSISATAKPPNALD